MVAAVSAHFDRISGGMWAVSEGLGKLGDIGVAWIRGGERRFDGSPTFERFFGGNSSWTMRNIN